MFTEYALLAAALLIAGLIALPALCARARRRASRDAREVAIRLDEFAASVRSTARCLPLDAAWLARAQALQMPEFVSFLLAQELARPNPLLLADTAQRLALRLKRRVAFEHKMLARTASGRRRGALAAAVPPLVLLVMAHTGSGLPAGALLVLLLLLLEASGCWLLWRVARVEI
jgi:Flp pilus assembly protein TadB